MKLADLADRVKRLAVADTNVDAEIALAIGWTFDPSIRTYKWKSPGGSVSRSSPPKFTASTDDAISGMPEGWRCGFEQAGISDLVQHCEAWAWPFESTWGPDWQLGYDSYRSHDRGVRDTGATPALALTAVLLRAHEAKAADRSGPQ